MLRVSPTTRSLTKISSLRVDARPAPVGIGSTQPEFSWTVVTDRPGFLQTGWHIRVRPQAGRTHVWDSGERDGDLPFGQLYGGPALESSAGYLWQVRVRDERAEWSAWSEQASFETGILDPRLWRAAWIAAPRPTSGALYLRSAVSIPEGVERARLYVSSLGWHRAFVNGTDLTGPALVPRFTPLGEEVEYQVYDVTNALRRGPNILGLAIGDGRYRGHLGYFDRRAVFGADLAGFAQLMVDLDDGRTLTFTTDHTWSSAPGRITATDPKYGEKVDLRIPDDDWLTDPVTPPRFAACRELPAPSRRLVAEQVERVTAVQRFQPRVWRSPEGAQLVDLGQNVAGILRMRLAGPAGRTVHITFSEVLTPGGELDPDWIVQNPLKPWRQRDEVILNGTTQWWQPWFTIHGFRYAQIDGLDHELGEADVEGIALSTGVEVSGSFAASDPRLTQLWHNVLWSTRSNFTDTPTDCPTRERSGWTGDIQAFAPTATGIVDAQAFLRRYLRSVALEQHENGNVPPWIPSEQSGTPGLRVQLLTRLLGNSVGWGDVTVLTPWTLYTYYGDTLVLQRQYRSMQLWVRRLGRAARRRGPARWFSPCTGAHERYILDSGFHWGEWLRPGEEYPANIADGTLHGAAIATAYFEHSARTLSRVADVLGRRSDHDRYLKLADLVRAAWRAAFVHDHGARIGRDLQDDYVRALAFGLLQPDEIDAAATRLEQLILADDTHLATGFLSTPMLLDVLCNTGRVETALDLLFQTSAPSWLGQIERGATTIWETWDGGYDHPDGRAHASHNHYAFGAIARWLRERLVGIQASSPGYRTIRIQPVVTDRLTWAEATVRTPFGEVSSRWHTQARVGTLEVTIPAGTTAQIILPDNTTHDRGAGTWRLAWSRTTQRALQGRGTS